jgi:multidrug transporter EmrE-like cation transporter
VIAGAGIRNFSRIALTLKLKPQLIDQLPPSPPVSASAHQLGSVTFVLALSHSDLTLAVPVTNGLKFAVNFAVGQFVLGEGRFSAKKVAGLAFVLSGIILQMI